MTELQIQKQSKNWMFYAAVLLAAVYLETSIYHHVLPDLEKLIDILQWYALILALLAIVYLIFIVSRNLPKGQRKDYFLRRFGSYEQMYLIFVFFWYIVTVALRQYLEGGNRFKTNDLWMFITGMVAFLYGPFARYSGAEKAKKTIECLLHLLIVPYAIFVAWVIWNYFHLNFVTFPSGRQLQLEAPAILHYTGVNHVSIGRQAFVMLGLSLYMIITQKPLVKILYSLDFAVFFAFLVLTNVRTSWYMASAMMACAAFVFCWNRLEKRRAIQRTAVGILLAVAVAVSCHLLRDGVFLLLKNAWAAENRTVEITASAETKLAPGQTARQLQTLSCRGAEVSMPSPKMQQLETEVSAAEEDDSTDYKRTIGNNMFSLEERIRLYRASLFVMFTSRYRFLFGVTPADVVPTLRGVYGVSKTFPYGHAHNFFLQMGVAFGVPTMIATIVFAGSLLVRSIRVIFINRKKLFSGAWMICLMVLFFLAADMFESGLNASLDFFCPAFYLLAGWLVALDMDTRAPKKNGKHAWF